MKRELDRPDEAPPAKRAKDGSRRIHFADVSVVLFDEALPVVSRFGGYRVPTSPTQHARHETKERDVRALDEATSLAHVHATELRETIRHVGLGIDPVCGCDDVTALQAQLDLLQDARLEATIAFGDVDGSEDDSASGSRFFQGKELLSGHIGSGYVFGHRFVTLDQYIMTMEDIEIASFLKSHDRPVPAFKLPTKAEKKAKVDPTQLTAMHFMNQGKPLDALALDELQLECTIRGMFDLASRKRVKKKLLVQKLRPIFEDEYHMRMAEQRQRTAMEDAALEILEAASTAKMRACLHRALVKRLASPMHDESDVTPASLSALFKLVVAQHLDGLHCSCPVPLAVPEAVPVMAKDDVAMAEEAATEPEPCPLEATTPERPETTNQACVSAPVDEVPVASTVEA
ncbi:hypothetical protein SDRG_05953 [Saprolegnia diclina VS20]|uniref:Uncharacterized protein n=1 Tax=Saprolegnia diclina (strain VS20) TaxID=1156394 RepID=T0QP63_SAPDV|nr:hypothetical protein SDRG_05953 [Saprolegnia diclina VS20]EQC36501.1 hypothetical protein SDRG_05953 [Saprolegnia diclina VS20]|eukprot:XP_008609922.1 hypothetical protein SDRG_05953 [Saprolegnia diclina VS20]